MSSQGRIASAPLSFAASFGNPLTPIGPPLILTTSQATTGHLPSLVEPPSHVHVDSCSLHAPELLPKAGEINIARASVACNRQAAGQRAVAALSAGRAVYCGRHTTTRNGFRNETEGLHDAFRPPSLFRGFRGARSVSTATLAALRERLASSDCCALCDASGRRRELCPQLASLNGQQDGRVARTVRRRLSRMLAFVMHSPETCS